MTMMHVEGMPEATSERIKVAAFDIDGVLLHAHLAEMVHAHLAVDLGLLIHPEKCEHLRELRDDPTEMLKYAAEVKHRSNGNPQLEYDNLVYEGFWEETFHTFHPVVVKYAAGLQYPDRSAIMLVEDLGKAGKQTAIWTSREDALVNQTLCPVVGRRDWVDIFITADDVGRDEQGKRRLKPHPRGGEMIREEFDVDYDEIMYFGDRPSDMIAARTLGMIACGVLGTVSRDDLTRAGAHYVVERAADARDWFDLAPLSAAEKQSRAKGLAQFWGTELMTMEEVKQLGLVWKKLGPW